jgi:hypothetical protein
MDRTERIQHRHGWKHSHTTQSVVAHLSHAANDKKPIRMHHDDDDDDDDDDDV